MKSQGVAFKAAWVAAGCLTGALMAAPAGAAPVAVSVQDFGSNVTAARGALDALSAGRPFVREDFEGFTSGDLVTDFVGGLGTAVGRLTRGAGASDGTGICDDDDANCTSPGILDAAGSPFNGRFNTTASGANWLDSNDVTELVWDVDVPTLPRFDRLAFLMTDMGDVGGTLTVTFASGATDSVAIAAQANGSINLISADFTPDVVSATVTFANTSTNDGFGIDDLTVVAVPAPATLGLFGLGLLALGAAAQVSARTRKSRR